MRHQLSASGGNLGAYLKAGSGITTIVSAHPTKFVACHLPTKYVTTWLKFCDRQSPEFWGFKNPCDVYLEIAENLHRAELTALERDEQVAKWVELNAERVSRQVDAKPQGGRPESGISAASRELGMETVPTTYRCQRLMRSPEF